MDFRARVIENPRLKDMSKLFELDQRAAQDAADRVNVRFRRHEKSLFASEGAKGGEPWARLSPGYKARKDRLFAGAIAEVQRIARARTGRKLRGAQLRKALGASNKILQLTGDMMRAFTTTGPDHISIAYRKLKNWVIQQGAQGPEWWGRHAEGSGGQKQRNPMQHTDDQWRLYLGDTGRGLIPHVMRGVRALAAWRRSRGR